MERSYKATSLQSCSLFEEKLTDLLLIVMPLSNAWAQNLIDPWSLRARVSTDVRARPPAFKSLTGREKLQKLIKTGGNIIDN